MTTINLKDFYYWYTQDQFIEVSDEVAEVFVSDTRHEMAYQRRLSRHKAQYSLDCNDVIGIGMVIGLLVTENVIIIISAGLCLLCGYHMFCR